MISPQKSKSKNEGYNAKYPYNEALFDLEVSPISMSIIRDIPIAISSKLFGPFAVALAN